MKHKNKKIICILTFIFSLYFILNLCLAASELFESLQNPISYHFGADMFGWRFKTQGFYVSYLVVIIFLALIGLLSGFFIKNRKKSFMLKVFIVLIYTINLIENILTLP